jgi:hypothetical protein
MVRGAVLAGFPGMISTPKTRYGFIPGRLCVVRGGKHESGLYNI